ncbi:unnamed protein product [marine sediment metagenome]|uniref:DUF998 domain-containing protein n=1 Tax=marine sediment metagenome TaxID=412755 RepID=X0VNC4_9ZZZZ
MVRRITGVCGITFQLVGITVLLVAAISNSPWFSWTENYISVLGVEGSAKTLFNGGLILAGIFSLIFAIGLGWCLLSGRLGQLAMVSLILGSIAVFDMGVFPRTFDFMHGAATTAFFVFITLALLLIGVVAITASQMAWGLLSITAGVLVAVPQLVLGPLSGGAIVQLFSYLPWSLWMIAFGVMLLLSPISLEHGKQ